MNTMEILKSLKDEVIFVRNIHKSKSDDYDKGIYVMSQDILNIIDSYIERCIDEQ